MKAFLKIKKSEWVLGSNNKMIYEDQDGKLFKGPPIPCSEEDTIIVEVSDGPINGYYEIIRIVGRTSESNKK